MFGQGRYVSVVAPWHAFARAIIGLKTYCWVSVRTPMWKKTEAWDGHVCFPLPPAGPSLSPEHQMTMFVRKMV